MGNLIPGSRWRERQSTNTHLSSQRTVVAALTEADFRSVDSYLSLAKQQMELNGLGISRALTIQMDQALRAAATGAPQASASATRGALRRASSGPRALAPCGAVLRRQGDGHCLVVAVARDRSQASNITLLCIRFVGAEATIDLPPTKTAQKGFTTPRTLSCCCCRLANFGEHGFSLQRSQTSAKVLLEVSLVALLDFAASPGSLWPAPRFCDMLARSDDWRAGDRLSCSSES